MFLKVLLILVAIMLAIECTITPPIPPSPSWPAQVDDGDQRGFGGWGRRCRSNNDCGWRRICVLRRCVPRPTGCFPACRKGQVCNNGVCQWPGGDCQQWCRPPRVCYPNGVCDYPRNYCGGRICSSNEICYYNKCVPNDGCYGRCVFPQTCFNGRCVTQGGGLCGGRICTPLQKCVFGKCVAINDNGCGGRCNSYQTCQRGQCLYPGQFCGGFISTCPDGFFCKGYKCQQSIDECFGCQPPKRCADSICRRPCGNCLSGQQCVNGFCYNLSVCIPGYPFTCPNGYSCQYGRCYRH